MWSSLNARNINAACICLTLKYLTPEMPKKTNQVVLAEVCKDVPSLCCHPNKNPKTHHNTGSSEGSITYAVETWHLTNL